MNSLVKTALTNEETLDVKTKAAEKNKMTLKTGKMVDRILRNM